MTTIQEISQSVEYVKEEKIRKRQKVLDNYKKYVLGELVGEKCILEKDEWHFVVQYGGCVLDETEGSDEIKKIINELNKVPFKNKILDLSFYENGYKTFAKVKLVYDRRL